MSLAELAARVDVTRNTLSRLERGDLSTSLGVLARVLAGWDWKKTSIGWLRTTLGQRMQDVRLRGRAAVEGDRRMTAARDRVVVHLDAAEVGPRQAVGRWPESRRGKERDLVRVRAGLGYLARCVLLESSVSFYEGEQYPPTLPGILPTRRRTAGDAR